MTAIKIHENNRSAAGADSDQPKQASTPRRMAHRILKPPISRPPNCRAHQLPANAHPSTPSDAMTAARAARTVFASRVAAQKLNTNSSPDKLTIWTHRLSLPRDSQKLPPASHNRMHISVHGSRIPSAAPVKALTVNFTAHCLTVAIGSVRCQTVTPRVFSSPNDMLPARISESGI